MLYVNRTLSWIKTHKAILFLLILVAYLVFRRTGISPVTYLAQPEMAVSTRDASFGVASKMGGFSLGGPSYTQYATPDYAPVQSSERMVVQNSHLSLVVKNVSETFTAIKRYAEQMGGYMVEGNLSNPQDAASGTITLRIPAKKLDEAFEFFHGQAKSVVSENLQGTDATDEFVDIDEQLRILQKNKARLEQIMDSAGEISDIVSIQQQVFNLQSQIDSLVGRQKYLASTASMAKVTIYLSTDELSLPYAPSNVWRPAVIVKHAVRSLMQTFQSVGTLLIWVFVYAAIWLPILGIAVYMKRRYRKQNTV